jgi:hypothetical protein
MVDRGRAIAAAGFSVLVLCAEEYQPSRSGFPGLKYVLHCPLDDADPSAAEVDRAMITAMSVADLYESGEDILVTCIAGRNRSGLVAALALHMITKRPMIDIVAHIQRTRQDPSGMPALTNPHFVALLRHVDLGRAPAVRRHRAAQRRRRA